MKAKKIELTFATGFIFFASASGTGSGPALDFSVALLPSPAGLKREVTCSQKSSTMGQRVTHN